MLFENFSLKKKEILLIHFFRKEEVSVKSNSENIYT